MQEPLPREYGFEEVDLVLLRPIGAGGFGIAFVIAGLGLIALVVGGALSTGVDAGDAVDLASNAELMNLTGNEDFILEVTNCVC